MGDRWFIERQGVAYGPADVSELSQWIAEGRLDWSDMLWPENTDRSTAVPAHTALQALGLVIQPPPGEAVASSAQLLTPQVEEIPNLQIDADTFEIPLLPASIGDESAATVPVPKVPAAGAKPVPDWVKSMAEAIEAERKKPRSVRPDWLEDVRQSEKAALPRRTHITKAKKKDA